MTLRRALRSALLSAALASALSGCSGTLDSLGSDASANGGSVGANGGTAGANGGSAGVLGNLQSFTGPPSYPDAFVSLLGVSEGDVTGRLDTAFTLLFYGDDDHSIYAPSSPNASYIKDPLHGDVVRSEGIGLAMVITVELGHRSEFDQLWNYAKAQMRLAGAGPGAGYFASYCDDDTITPCLDTYGMQQFAVALILAHRRWGIPDNVSTYATDALTLLDLLKNGVGSAFDHTTQLVAEQPTLAPAKYTRSSLEMPAAYELWYKATGDTFWQGAAKAAREHMFKSAHAKTGLWPLRSNTSDGAPATSNGTGSSGVAVSPGFIAQGYRTQLNLALDVAWAALLSTQAQKTLLQPVADRLLTFFDQASNNHDLTSYGANFAVDGTLTLDDGMTPAPNPPVPSQALISVNGALVLAASDANVQRRHDFVNALWQQQPPSGKNRYYEGLLYMMSLLITGGQMKLDWS